MRKIFSRVIAILLAVLLCFQYIPKANRVYAANNYNASAALAYASAHWNDGVGLCAEFVSRCAQAGGLNIGTYGYTIDCFEAIESATGVQRQDLSLDSNGHATKALNPNKLAAGDIVIQWCYTDGLRPHIAICCGFDGSGRALYYAHNSAMNAGLWPLNSHPDHYGHSLGAKVLHISNSNQDPVGDFDTVWSAGVQKIQVSGWAFDPDEPSKSINVHIYVGGEAGQAGVESYSVATDVQRDDINNHFKISGKHGFVKTITVKKSGVQKVAVYAINSKNGNNPRIGEVKTVTITKDTEKPKVTNARIYNVTKDGYDVSFNVSDNVGVVKAECPTWTDKGGQDDIIWHQAVIKDGVATCHIKRSDHNNEFGTYVTHCYAWDSQNNYGAVARSTVVEEHEWNTYYTVDKNATCTSKGQKSIHCKTCAATKDTVEIPALGHKYVQSITVATPQTDGKIVNKCSVCGSISSNTVIPRMGEVIVSPESVKYTGKELKPSVVVKDSKGNVISSEYYSVSYKNNINVGLATVIIKGKVRYSGELKGSFAIIQNSSQSDIDPKSPQPSSKSVTGVGIISADGKTLKGTDGKKYYITEKLKLSQVTKNKRIADKKTGGKYKVTKLLKKNGKVVGGELEYVAPYNKNCKLVSATGRVKIAGATFKVTCIGRNAFKGCKKLEKVIVGSSVSVIGTSAFDGCSKLTYVKINTRLIKRIGANAFRGINQNAVIYVPHSKYSDYSARISKSKAPQSVVIKKF